MSTRNFSTNNSSVIFAFGDDEYEYIFDEIRTSIKNGGFEYVDMTEIGETIYDGEILGTVYSPSKSYKEFSVELKLDIIVRSGYYEGGNFDWDLTLDVEGETYEYENGEFDYENIAKDLMYTYDYSEKKAEQYAGYIKTFIDSEAEEIIIKTERIISENTTKLGISAQFSNGETWYTKIS